MNLIYISSSYEDLAYANAIQVRNMAMAFANFGMVTLVMKASDSILVWPKNVVVKRIKTGRGRINNALYSLKAFVFFMRNRNNFQFVFSRNTLFSLICGSKNSSIGHCFEFHTYVEGKMGIVFQNLLMKRTDMCVAISASLQKKLSLLRAATDKHVVVFHDAHNNKAVCQAKTNGKLKKVGYFGSINEIKGDKLLSELIDAAPDFNFYIYSPDLNKLKPKPNVFDYRYIPYESIFETMRSMDFLLMINTPRGNDRDITKYTSPLKLFEYLSVAGVVIASNNPPLLEIIKHKENGYIVENDVKEWYSALSALHQNDVLYHKISAGALETAQLYTWDSRAKGIMREMQLRKKLE